MGWDGGSAGSQLSSLLLIIINVLILVAGIVSRRRVVVIPVDIVACQRVLKKVLPLGPACWHSTAAPALLGFPQSPIFLLKNTPSVSKPSSLAAQAAAVLGL